MLKLTDLRKTTRRSDNGQSRTVYPRFLRDRTLAPRIELAVRYLESMRGRTRRELDAEVIVQLFGDHKIARCVVACLAASYRHRARTFAEALTPERAAVLAARGIVTPSDLRLWLFRRANTAHAGFVGAAVRPAFVSAAAENLDLTAHDIDVLIGLDLPANAILVRTGPVPKAADVIARYNYEIAAALLANASIIRLSLSRAARDADTVRDICVEADVTAELASRELVLQGRQDATGGWARHGARLVRTLAALLACGLPVRSGEALVAAPGGGEWRFRLDAAVLNDLGAPAPDDAPLGDALALLAVSRSVDALASDFAVLRRAGATDGWTIRRATEPVIRMGAMVPTLFICTRGWRRVYLVPAPTATAGVERLAALAAHVPLVAVRVAGETAVAPVEEATGPLTLTYASRHDVAALPSLLARAAGDSERAANTDAVVALVEEARAAGVLTDACLAERLGCAEEDIWARLAAPEVRAHCQAQGLAYVEGFGLCSPAVLARAQAAADDVRASTDQAWAVTPARHVTLLGRRLREVTGASAGIECLIAYLGAA
ncbi:MAG TPA: DUF790 family protein [Ktedonobacterales bacterium]|nr:DUF790 family protein [Ktedonobacterales bacterium]